MLNRHIPYLLTVPQSMAIHYSNYYDLLSCTVTFLFLGMSLEIKVDLLPLLYQGDWWGQFGTHRAYPRYVTVKGGEERGVEAENGSHWTAELARGQLTYTSSSFLCFLNQFLLTYSTTKWCGDNLDKHFSCLSYFKILFKMFQCFHFALDLSAKGIVGPVQAQKSLSTGMTDTAVR